MSDDEDAGYDLGFALGVALGPIAAAAILFLLACLLGVVFSLLQAVCLIAIIGVRTIAAIGHAVVAWASSGWTLSWALVAAQIVLGVLLGFAAGLRAQKPGVSREG